MSARPAVTLVEIARRRLAGQRLAGPPFATPVEVVAQLGAVQAQDYAGAKWAIGQRTHGVTDADVERAFNDGAILRTHVLRPTWHFVTPADIRWMLALTAPRVNALHSYHYKRHELDEALFRRSNAALVKALRDGNHLTRVEIMAVLKRARIDPGSPERVGHVTMRAELDGVICSGPRRGKQFTYALLDERAPRAKLLERDDALGQLATRYFTTHGPATAQDFAWWSGLTIADAKRAVEAAGAALESIEVEGRAHWSGASTITAPPMSQAHTAHLLPNFDEYFIGFRDRGAMLARLDHVDPSDRSVPLVGNLVVLDGQFVGIWRRTITGKVLSVELSASTRLARPQRQLIAAQVKRYGAFLGVPTSPIWSPARPPLSGRSLGP